MFNIDIQYSTFDIRPSIFSILYSTFDINLSKSDPISTYTPPYPTVITLLSV